VKVTPNLLRWQRDLYPAGHANRLNLVLHLVSVPVFVAGALTLVYALATFAWGLAGLGAAAVVAAIAVQGFGHSREIERPEPFLSPLDFVARFAAENFVTFWRFLASGDFRRRF